MWKKMEGVSAQTGRTRLKKQKPQQCEIIQQMNSDEIGQDVDRKMLHQINFRFEPQGINRKDARVHSKQGTRRVGGKVVIQRQKQTGQKENNGPRRVVKVEENILRESGSQVVLLGVKSCLAEKDEGKTSTKNQKHTRYSSNADSCNSQAQDDQSINITAIPTKSTDEIFREINRRMAQEKQSTRVRKTNQNCLFYNLKRKLQREMMRIEGQSQRNECKLMIQGCEIQKHRRNVNSAASLTERSRPRSALSSARTYSSAAKEKGKVQRPLSCKTRSQVTSHEIKRLQTQSQRLLGSKDGKTERNTTREKECQRKYIANSLITFDNSHSLKPYKSNTSKAQKKHAEDNQKLNSILNECFTHEVAFSDVTNKMRTFEYYCKKMSAGMQKATTKLDDLNEMGKFDD